MKEFYILKGKEEKGPFTLQELQNMNISPDTLVWYEGMENWKRVVDINELKELFISPKSERDLTDSLLSNQILQKVLNNKWGRLALAFISSWILSNIVFWILNIRMSGDEIFVFSWLLVLLHYFYRAIKKTGKMKIYSIITLFVSFIGLIVSIVMVAFSGSYLFRIGELFGVDGEVVFVALLLAVMYNLYYFIYVMINLIMYSKIEKKNK